MYSTVENSSGNVPAFLIKLWSLVEDPTTDELIHWDTGGTSFHVYDQQRFSREILPLYFKHNNIASFIRQLNMYGFRKVTHIDQGGLKIEKDDLHFQHQYFQKGERDMLQYIKRKVSNPLVRPATDGMIVPKSDEVSRVLSDVKQVKVKQESMDTNLEYIKRENKLLWQEVALLRQKHHKQQQIVNKLIQFLVSLVSSSRTGITIPGLRRAPLAINNISQMQSAQQAAASSELSTLLQGNISNMGSSFVGQSGNTVPSSNEPDYIIDDGEYTIESPHNEVLLSPTPSSGGPIIHELTDIVATTTANQVATKQMPQQNIILTTQAATNKTQGITKGAPINFVLVSPQGQTTQVAASPSVVMGNTNNNTNNSNNTVLVTPSVSASPQMIASPSSLVLSPKVEPAPSLEDALNYGLVVPPSPVVSNNNGNLNLSGLSSPLAARSQRATPGVSTIVTSPVKGKKRPGQIIQPQESGSSPTKRPVRTLPVNWTLSQQAGNNNKSPISQTTSTSSSARTTGLKPSPRPQIVTNISPAQVASLDSLVQANSDLNTPTSVIPTTTQEIPAAPSSMSPGQQLSLSNSSSGLGDLMTMSAKQESDDPCLSSDQLELLTSDLDGLRGILQDQYKVDPSFLMENPTLLHLFDSTNPWNIEAEKEVEEARANRDGASTSGIVPADVTGTELVEYNPQDNFFPEDLLMGDSLIGDIDDID